MRIRFDKINVICVAFCLILAGCNSNYKNQKRIETWKSCNSQNTIKTVDLERQCSIPDDFFPFCGTVSHHLLTDKLIDDWFLQIKMRRDVKTFYIICPSHFGLSAYNYSVANCKWCCGKDDYVYTDCKAVNELCKKLDVPFENTVFSFEHGASTLMPYIKKYFPDAKVAVVAVNGEPPVNVPYIQKLFAAFESCFTEEKKKNNFLIISSDFSHHHNQEETAVRDNRTKLFFENSNPDNFLNCICDNRSGMYVLANILPKNSKAYVLYHTNAFELSGLAENDITSYFFSLF